MEGGVSVVWGGGVENASAVSLFKKIVCLILGGGSGQVRGGGSPPPKAASRKQMHLLFGIQAQQNA